MSKIPAVKRTPAAFRGKISSVHLQIYVMLAAIVAIMLFFTFTTEGAYLSARNIFNLLRQTSITGILAVGWCLSSLRRRSICRWDR